MQLPEGLRFVALSLAVGCAPEVIVIDGDGDGSGGAATAPVVVGAGTTGGSCPMSTQGYDCPAACDAIVLGDNLNYCAFACDLDTPTGCPPTDTCASGACLPGPCEFTGLCPSHFLCVEPGYCIPTSYDEERVCRMHASPPSGCEAECAGVLSIGGATLCTAECADYPCGTGHDCVTLLGELVCVPRCFSDADCPNGLGCDDAGDCAQLL